MILNDNSAFGRFKHYGKAIRPYRRLARQRLALVIAELRSTGHITKVALTH